MAKAATTPQGIFRQVISDLEGMDITPDIKKKVLKLMRDAAEAEGVVLAKKGEKEDDVWKGIFLAKPEKKKVEPKEKVKPEK